MEADGVQLLNWRSRKLLSPVERNTRVAVLEPDEARFGRLGGEVERAAMGGVWAGGGGGGLAEEVVQRPVAFLAHGAAVADVLAGAAALEVFLGVADGAERGGVGGDWWGGRKVFFQKEGGAEVLGGG